MTSSRPATALTALMAALLLGSCSAPTGEISPTPAPTDDEMRVVGWSPVEPDEFASPLIDGYDFVVAGGTIACGIHDLRESDFGVSYGCVMTGPYTFTDPPTPTQEISCGGGFIGVVGSPPESLCRGGLVYAGEDPSLGTPELPDFRYINALGVTCLVEGSSITCTDDEAGSGFRMSAKEYELFL